MKRLRTYRIAPLALIACVLISQAACGADKLRTVAKAENVTAQSLKSIATLIKSAQDSGEITAAQALALKAPLSEVVQANAMAIQISRDWLNSGSVLTADTQARILNALAKVSDALVKLNSAGTLHIHNPNSQTAFNGLVIAIQGAVASVVIILIKK